MERLASALMTLASTAAQGTHLPVGLQKRYAGPDANGKEHIRLCQPVVPAGHSHCTAGDIALGETIKLIAAPVFIATKLEAFKDRGKDASGQPDLLGSHDLEDIITVSDRRPELIEECGVAPR